MDLERAASIANAAAGVTVGEIGNGTISRPELDALAGLVPTPRRPLTSQPSFILTG
jgi:bifunctional ADP-heptose synthase (sugar kinase/adenylyltransferase)